MNRRAKIRITLSLVAIVAAWSVAAWAAARFLIVETDDGSRADVIFVLSGSATYVERTHRAAELFREGRAPKIILTNDGGRGGWSSAEQRNPLFVERAARELEASGVPRERIEILPSIVRHTTDEAVHARAEAEKENWQTILVVTSAYHTRRARWIFEDEFEGSNVKLLFTHAPTGFQSPPPATWWLSPRGWNSVALEYIKMLAYFVLSYES